MTGKIVDPESGRKIPIAPTIKEVISNSQSWIKLALFLVSMPLTIVVLLVFAMSFVFPLYVCLPVGITLGLFLSVLYMDKLLVMLK